LAASSILATIVVALAGPLPASAAPTPSVTVSDITVVEGNGGSGAATFTIKASPRPRACCSLTVDWSTEDGTAAAPTDYTSRSGTITFSRRMSSVTVTVPVKGDLLDEVDESFTVHLSNLTGGPGTIGDATGVGTISDDDAMPSVSVWDGFATEGDAGTADLTYTVVLSAPSGRVVDVDWATVDGTAAEPADYVSASGTVSFNPGETSKTVTVAVVGDEVAEGNETFGLALSAPANAAVSVAAGTGTILDDDGAAPGRLATALTLGAVARPLAVKAKGLLEPAAAGQYVRVKLLHKRNGAFAKISAKLVAIKDIRDRDADAAPDGRFVAAFARPHRSGAYKLAVCFVGTGTHSSSMKSVTFKL
jgi:hypothetical protein